MKIRRKFQFALVFLFLGTAGAAQESTADEQWPVDPDTLAVMGWPGDDELGGGVTMNTSRAYGPGEVLSYGFSYGFLTAAKAVVTVKAGSRARRTVEVEARGKSVGAFSWFFKIDDNYQSELDYETGLPIRFLRDVHEGGYELHQDYRFDWEKRTVFDGDDYWLLNEPMYDMLSAIYAMRDRELGELTAGDTLRIATWVDGKPFNLKMLFSGRARVEVEDGHWPCLAFQPLIQTGRIWKNSEDLQVYVSDDKNRIPVLVESRLRFGTVRMELLSATGLNNPSMRGPE